MKNWKRRSFVLTNTDLLYYESETSTQPLGVIPLTEIERVVDSKDDKVAHSFKIFTTAGKKFVIQAPTAEEKRTWMRSVMSTQQQSDLMTKAAAALKARDVRTAACSCGGMTGEAGQWYRTTRAWRGAHMTHGRHS